MKIRPIIFQTNQTNKTYSKSIKIEGNFNTINKNIDIFINYKDLLGFYANSSYDIETLENMVLFFCSIYPDKCPTTVINADESTRNITFTINEETYKEGILEEDSFRDEIRDTLKDQNEKLILLENKTEDYLDNSNETSNDVRDLSDNNKNMRVGIIVAGIIFLIIVIVVGISIIFFNKKVQIKLRKFFHKGERPL